jgi:hypothetical protein
MMKDPFRWLPVHHQGRAFALLALLAVALMATLNVLGVPLRSGVAPAGIISYEFAGDTQTARQILQAWGSEGRMYAGLNLGLDYVFLFAYGAAIALGCAIVARGLRGRSPALSTIGAALAWLMIGAASLDVVENYALIRLLLGSEATSLPLVARLCASIKFLVVGLSLLYVVLGALAARALPAERTTAGS